MGVWPRLRSVIKTDIRDKTPSFWWLTMPSSGDGGGWRGILLAIVGERESERSHLDYKRKRER